MLRLNNLIKWHSQNMSIMFMYMLILQRHISCCKLSRGMGKLLCCSVEECCKISTSNDSATGSWCRKWIRQESCHIPWRCTCSCDLKRKENLTNWMHLSLQWRKRRNNRSTRKQHLPSSVICGGNMIKTSRDPSLSRTDSVELNNYYGCCRFGCFQQENALLVSSLASQKWHDISSCGCNLCGNGFAHVDQGWTDLDDDRDQNNTEKGEVFLT